MGRHELTDAQWNIIKEMIPSKARKTRERPQKNNRQIINGISGFSAQARPGVICQSDTANGKQYSAATTAIAKRSFLAKCASTLSLFNPLYYKEHRI